MQTWSTADRGDGIGVGLQQLARVTDGSTGRPLTHAFSRAARWPRPVSAPPITRATAERHLACVIDRARSFNADGSHVIEIAELVVFGSYLDPDVQHLGDLDLGATLRDRIVDTTVTVGQSEIRLNYAKASGGLFGGLIEKLSWPEKEALAMLCNRSTVINITTENVRP